MKFEQWEGFNKGDWENEINVRNFIQLNYTPYTESGDFLASPTENTKKLWNIVLDLYKEEKEKGGVLAIDADTVSTITSHKAGYINKELEKIVGLQTDSPLKRAIMPNGGIRILEKACAANGVEINKDIKTIYTKYRRTHNDGVFAAYTPEIKAARKSHIITGLPDGYGRRKNNW